MKNKKQIIASILLGATILSAVSLAGCDGDTGTNTPLANNTPVVTNAPVATNAAPVATNAPLATNAAPIATEAPQNNATTPATQQPAVNNAVLTDLPYTDNGNAREWGYYEESDVFTLKVTPNYCVDTDVVSALSYSTIIKKTASDYAEHLSEDKIIQDTLLAMNDPKIVAILTEDEDGYMFHIRFENLHKADRAHRIAAAEEYIGLTANHTDSAFYYSSIVAELTSYGFQ